MLKECLICSDAFPEDRFLVVPGCGHVVCHFCHEDILRDMKTNPAIRCLLCPKNATNLIEDVAPLGWDTKTAIKKAKSLKKELTDLSALSPESIDIRGELILLNSLVDENDAYIAKTRENAIKEYREECQLHINKLEELYNQSKTRLEEHEITILTTQIKSLLNNKPGIVFYQKQGSLFYKIVNRVHKEEVCFDEINNRSIELLNSPSKVIDFAPFFDEKQSLVLATLTSNETIVVSDFSKNNKKFVFQEIKFFPFQSVSFYTQQNWEHSHMNGIVGLYCDSSNNLLFSRYLASSSLVTNSYFNAHTIESLSSFNKMMLFDHKGKMYGMGWNWDLFITRQKNNNKIDIRPDVLTLKEYDDIDALDVNWMTINGYNSFLIGFSSQIPTQKPGIIEVKIIKETTNEATKKKIVFESHQCDSDTIYILCENTNLMLGVNSQYKDAFIQVFLRINEVFVIKQKIERPSEVIGCNTTQVCFSRNGHLLINTEKQFIVY